MQRLHYSNRYKKNVTHVGFFFFLQFYDVATLTIVHKSNYRNFGYKLEKKKVELKKNLAIFR
jgi:membrane protein YdbS with pleckstrin-like domain